MFRAVFACLLLLALSACQTNPYAQFYKTYPVNPDNPVRPLPYNGAPQVMKATGDWRADAAKMYEEGYGAIGESSFRGQSMPIEQALTQASAAKASHVLVWSQYQSTQSGAMPIVVPTAFGPTTTFVPQTTTIHEQRAVYFAPLTRYGIGIYAEDIPAERRQEAGTNSGVWIRTVRKASPAFRADILPNDIILAIDNRQVEGQKDMNGIIQIFGGKTVELSISRKGQTIKKSLAIPAGEWPAS